MIQRKLSLEDDFMNFKTNDLLYGFMRGLSTARPVEGQKEWQEYLPKKTFKKNKKLIAGICGCTTKTIDNQINKLFEAGLLDEGIEVVESNGKEYEYECFWFPCESKTYKIVEQDIIKYLVNTRNSQAIRIYLYLLNKFQWKKDYIFTIGEIRNALGYSETTTSCYGLIKQCLASFREEGLIKYEKIIEEKDIGGLNEEKIIPVERMKLKYVLEKANDLPKF